MFLSGEELCEAIRPEARPKSRIEQISRSKSSEPSAASNFSEKLCSSTVSMCFGQDDPLFGNDGLAKNAEELYLEAASSALNSIEKLDETAAGTIYKVIDFLASDARVSFQELEMFKQQIYQCEKANRELEERIRSLKNENAKNVEIVQIGVERLQEEEEEILEQEKQLGVVEEENDHLNSVLKAEQKESEASELEMVELRERRDKVIRENNEMTTGSIAIRTAYENAVCDIRIAREETEQAKEELVSTTEKLNEYVTLFRLKEEQISQLEIRKNQQLQEVREENKQFYEIILTFIAAFAQLGLTMHPEQLKSQEYRENIHDFVEQLLRMEAELIMLKKGEEIRNKGELMDKVDISGRKGRKESSEVMEILMEELQRGGAPEVRLATPTAEKAIQTLKYVFVISESGLIKEQVDYESNGQNITKIAAELSGVEDDRLLQIYARIKDCHEEIKIKGDKKLKEQIAANFVPLKKYVRLLHMNKSLNKLILIGKKENVSEEGIILTLLQELQTLGLPEENIVDILSQVGCDPENVNGFLEKLDTCFSQEQEQTFAANSQIDDLDNSEDETSLQLQRNENERGKLKHTSTPMIGSESALLDMRRDSSYQYLRPVTLSQDEETDDIPYVKCLCVKCAESMTSDEIHELIGQNKEPSRNKTNDEIANTDTSRERFLIKCAAALKTEREECEEQLQELEKFDATNLPHEKVLTDSLHCKKEELKECEQLIIDTLLQNSKGVRHLVEDDNKSNSKQLEAVDEIIVKSVNYQVERAAEKQYPLIYQRSSLRLPPISVEKNGGESDKHLAMSVTRPKNEEENPTAVSSENIDPCTAPIHNSKIDDKDTDSMILPPKVAIVAQKAAEDIIPERLSSNSAATTNLQKANVIPPIRQAPERLSNLALTSVQEKLNQCTIDQQMMQTLNGISADLNEGSSSGLHKGKDTSESATLYQNMERLIALNNLDSNIMRDFVKESENNQTLQHIHSTVKHLLAPAPVYEQKIDGLFRNPFKQLIKSLEVAGRHGHGKNSSDGHIRQKIINLEIRMEETRIQRMVNGSHLLMESEDIDNAVRSSIFYQTEEVRDAVSRRATDYLELRSICEDEEAKESPVFFEWLAKSEEESLISYCREMIVHSGPEIEQPTSESLDRLRKKYPFLISQQFISHHALICEENIESKTPAEVGSQVYYVVSLEHYSNALKKLAKQAGALIMYRGGYAFVRLPFKVVVKSAAWVTGIINQLMLQFDQARRLRKGETSEVSVFDLVENWASKMYGLNHLVCLLKFHLLVGLLFYQSTLPAAELFYQLYTGYFSADEVEFLIYVRDIIRGCDEDYQPLAEQIFLGLDRKEISALKSVLSKTADVYGAELVLLSEFQALRTRLAAQISDQFGKDETIPSFEFLRIVGELIPHAPLSELERRLGGGSSQPLERVFIMLNQADLTADNLVMKARAKLKAAESLVDGGAYDDEDAGKRMDMLRRRVVDYCNAGFGLGAVWAVDQFVQLIVSKYIYK